MPGRSSPKNGPAVATVVLMRAVNVGGHAVVRPKAVASRLEAFDVISLGAAGTFLVRRPPPSARLTEAFQKALGFETEVIQLPLPELAGLLDAGPADWRSPPAGTRRFLTFLAADPVRVPSLPLAAPAGAGWHLRVLDRQGRSLRTIRKLPTSVPWTYPNPVIEKAFGVPATTRGWETLDELRAQAA